MALKGVRDILTVILSYALCLAVLYVSSSVGAVDMPDFKRKLNTVPVPRLGGIGFFIAFFASLALKWLFFGEATVIESTLVLTGGLTLLLGAADDFFDLSPMIKLAFQGVISLISAIMLSQGEPVSSILTKAIYILLLINSFNFIDGLDGLCAGISISSLFFFSLCDLIFLHTGMGICAILLLLSLVGFIPLNVYPAKLYMGDAGSETLGLAVALFSLSYINEGLFIVSVFALIPIADALIAITRRLAARRSPFKADKEHLHHKLLDLGLSHPAAVNLLVIISVFVSFLSLSVYLFAS